jgi:NADPH:quinone reductase-like Zn-dependent oxidoreductase
VHVVGFVGGTTAAIDLVQAVRRAVTLRAASTGSRDSFEALVRAFETHGVRPAIDRVFPAVEARAAFAHLERGGHLGKIIVAV